MQDRCVEQVVDPNPLRLGFSTGGPSRSVHHSCSLRIPSSPITSHSTSSQPRGVENAPYLAALVHSSCSAIDTARAVLAGSVIGCWATCQIVKTELP